MKDTKPNQHINPGRPVGQRVGPGAWADEAILSRAQESHGAMPWPTHSGYKGFDEIWPIAQNQNSSGGNMTYKFLNASIALLACTLLLGCDVEKTQEGKLPKADVDVKTEPGQMPKYDVKTPDVDVGTKEKSITVPDVDVRTKEKQVTVPDVNVTMPDENKEKAQQ